MTDTWEGDPEKDAAKRKRERERKNAEGKPSGRHAEGQGKHRGARGGEGGHGKHKRK